MDRRLTPFSGRIAHLSLQGQVEAEGYTEGSWHRIVRMLVDLDRKPGGARDRQLLWGDRVLVIDRQDGHAFVQSEKDGYCGWLPEAALGPDHPVTHRVITRFSQVYAEAEVEQRETATLPWSAQVQVMAEAGRFVQTPYGYMPKDHLRPLDEVESDPVAVAERLLGTPYLWGANSVQGIDCSGLAQAALGACGIAAPGDSDMQAAGGRPVQDDTVLQPGDLVFWKGHVAMVSGPDEIIHATAAFMQVVRESLSGAVERIRAQGKGEITHRRRYGAE